MFQLLEFFAVVTAATYGIFQARAAKMDVLGVFVVSSTVAFGGGTLRDLFLDRHPLFWISNPHYPLIVFFMAVVSCLIRSIPPNYKKYLDIPDAIGMGLFSIVGTQFALEAGTNYFIAAFMGVITGTFGGVISDVFCNRVPTLFKSAPLYATCSFVGCWVFLMVHYFGMADSVAAFLGIITVVLTRFAALYWNITLPEMNDERTLIE